jgi:hypothetical protein
MSKTLRQTYKSLKKRLDDNDYQLSRPMLTKARRAMFRIDVDPNPPERDLRRSISEMQQAARTLPFSSKQPIPTR